jgi:hypothetical protein
VVRFANYLRAAVPADRVGDVQVYVGTAHQYLAGPPPPTGQPERDALARSYWDRLASADGPAPLAVALESFDAGTYREALALPGAAPLGPGVVRVSGPSPAHLSPTEEAAVGGGPFSPWTPAWVAAAVLAVLWSVGWAWSRAALPHADPLVRRSLGPAFGMAALSLASVAVDSLGVRLGGAGAAVALAVAAAGGLAALAARRSPPSG